MTTLPFGEEIGSGVGGRTTGMGYGAADGIRKKFTGYERDAETGLDYAQARYFSAIQGRFTSPDPLMASAKPVDPQSWNRYAYVGNNPMVFSDPSGMSRGPAGLYSSIHDTDRAPQSRANHTLLEEAQAIWEQRLADTMAAVAEAEWLNEAAKTDPDGAAAIAALNPMITGEESQTAPQANVNVSYSDPSYAQIPASGVGYYRSHRPAVSFGNLEVLASLIDFAADWNKRHPDHDIAFGEMSDMNGRTVYPHNHHKLGLRIDIRPMRNDGQHRETNFRDPSYSQALTIELARGLRSLPNVRSILFNDPVLIKMRLTRPEPKHDDHLHVTFTR